MNMWCLWLRDWLLPHICSQSSVPYLRFCLYSKPGDGQGLHLFCVHWRRAAGREGKEIQASICTWGSQKGQFQEAVHVEAENIEMDSRKTLCVDCSLEIISLVDMSLRLTYPGFSGTRRAALDRNDTSSLIALVLRQTPVLREVERLPAKKLYALISSFSKWDA